MNNKTIIISNNSNTTKQLENLMAEQMPGMQLVGSAKNTNEGLMMLQLQQPHLVIVNLEDLTAAGFLQLKQIKNAAFSIIFITPTFLKESFLFSRHSENTKHTQNTKQPQETVNTVAKKKPGIELKINSQTKWTPFEEIIRLEASSNYTKIFLTNLVKPVLIAKTLKFYVNQLDAKIFIKSHRAHLINKSFVASYSNGGEPHLVLKNNEKIMISRRKLSAIKQIFKE